ncbi:hypothetical protein K443DRAFT_5091 [Laccaria amethystina LaAM-08-1]|uniref:Uncharacterized protein n=1 Tax=Laccaria amethystina LaAM-08-1 TaxID=1095629 RepID=A0A0C9Y6T2_9AGAR|nr:hypothetical protein K443DRAFT_5091 [Laccaria amethystina LaAM-08-1]
MSEVVAFTGYADDSPLALAYTCKIQIWILLRAPTNFASNHLDPKCRHPHHYINIIDLWLVHFTFRDYDVKNMAPTSAHLPTVTGVYNFN